MRACLTALLLFITQSATAQETISPNYRVLTTVELGMKEPLAMAEDAFGRLFITDTGGSIGNGRVNMALPGNNYATTFAETPQLFDPAGIVFSATRLWVAHRGTQMPTENSVIVYFDSNNNGRIQTDEFQIVDFAISPPTGFRTMAEGKDGFFYVAQGAMTSDGEGEQVGLTQRNAAVWRFDPTLDNPSPQVVAYGFYRPRGLVLSATGEIFVTDISPQGAGPDELNLAQVGAYHGFPELPGREAVPPLVSFPPFSSPAGIAYFEPCRFTNGKETVFAALSGDPSGSGDPAPKIVAVEIVREATGIRAVVEDFAVGFEAPYGLLKTKDDLGNDALLVSDSKEGKIHLIRIRTETDPPDVDVDGDGQVNETDLLIMLNERARKEPDRADLDRNADIDYRDLFMLSSGWYTNDN